MRALMHRWYVLSGLHPSAYSQHSAKSARRVSTANGDHARDAGLGQRSPDVPAGAVSPCDGMYPAHLAAVSLWLKPYSMQPTAIAL